MPSVTSENIYKGMRVLIIPHWHQQYGKTGIVEDPGTRSGQGQSIALIELTDPIRRYAEAQALFSYCNIEVDEEGEKQERIDIKLRERKYGRKIQF